MAQRVRKMKPKKVEGERTRAMLITVVALLVVLAVVMGIAVIKGGGSDVERGIVAQEDTAPSDSAPDNGLVITDVEVPGLSVYRRRNPFKPLIDLKSTIECVEEEAPITPLGGGVIQVPPELNPGVPESSPEIVATMVSLEEIREEGGTLFARVRVGDQLFEKVAVGDTFAENYRLLALGRETGATVLYGDERFSLFLGQSIYW